MRRGRMRLVWILLVAAVSFAIGGLAALFLARRATDRETVAAARPAIAPVPAFTLTASDGSTVGRDNLLGRPWVADFIFTSCAGVCPVLSSRMASLQEALPEDWAGMLVSITVDPETDTPEVLRDYAARHGARPGRWIFLTGEQEAIHRLSVEGFRLGAAENPGADLAAGEEPFIHSTRMVLVDGEGWIRGYYDGTDAAESERLLRDLRAMGEGEDGA